MDFESGIIKAVAHHLLGDPNEQLSKNNELRYGKQGSLKIAVAENTFYDHERNEGGGILDLVRREAGLDTNPLAVKWLQDNDYIPREQEQAKAKEVKSYDYRDESGRLLFQVVRYEPKTFKQRRPNGTAWEYKVQGTRQVPYRLPELLAAPINQDVFIVEGEKDADRLAELGLVATCNAGGAGKWRASHAEHLKDRTAIVIADNDDAGRDHIEKVAKSLRGIASSVRLLELPGLAEKGDVSDWLDAGGTVEELLMLPATAPAKQLYESAGIEPDGESEQLDNHRNAPRPDPACLYGLVGDVARAGGENTEANPYAIAANFISYMSAAVGRGPYMQVGNTWHHPRQFTLHIGRTGRGRKGDAVALVHRIDRAVRLLDQHAAPQVHRGGLSSREGLVFLIHDGYKEGKTEIDPIHDKRLWVVESEFTNILQQGKRDGNTLSPALRDCWDGVSLKPATKSNRLYATDPHVNVSAAITPTELLSVMATKDLTNGFANRFLMFWAERIQITPFPKATSQEDMNKLAVRVLEVLNYCEAQRFVETDRMRIDLSDAAKSLYVKLYRGELNDNSAGERITALLERRAPMLLRLAMLFALCDLKDEVDEHHIKAALAWVRYSVESVKFVFASAADEMVVAETNDTAQKIIAYLGEVGKASRWDLNTHCFKGHTSKTRLDAALDELLSSNPPQIAVESVPRPKGSPGNATKIYQVTGAKSAKSAKREDSRGLQGDSEKSEVCEVCEVSFVDEPDFAALRTLRKEENGPQTRVGVETPHTSQTSPTNAETEVF